MRHKTSNLYVKPSGLCHYQLPFDHWILSIILTMALVHNRTPFRAIQLEVISSNHFVNFACKL